MRVSQSVAVDIVFFALWIYAQRMKASTVDYAEMPEPFDIPRKVRSAMAEERLTASDLARTFGGAVSYWTRRMTGQQPFSARDLELIAWMTARHPAEFVGGMAPPGWVPAECPHSDSNREPTDYMLASWLVPA